jgi:CRP-like cAMP-binding protein/thioredoxin reductase/Fe-S-cluster-containing hydrogenase component 2
MVEIAIIGGGPGGLAAASRAAKEGVSHLLFEKGEVGNTIYEYQRRKHVMAEPSNLPLNALLPFEAATREEVLSRWTNAIRDLGVKVRRAEVSSIRKTAEGHFELSYSGSDEPLLAKNVVLAIGLQGSPRKLGVEGEEQAGVSYTLSDPDEFKGQHIIVVGAGDAAIENAIALAENNTVSIVNRSNEFPRAKSANVSLILNAISRKRIQCFYDSSVARVEERFVILNTPEGETRVKCNQLIARLGAIPPRAFVESCGVRFPSKDPSSVPAVSERFESEVPGLYLIGSLVGYPLIKHALNQGDEVVRHILGLPVRPADQDLIEAVLAPLGRDPMANLSFVRTALGCFESLSTAQFRELLLESEILRNKRGEKIIERNDYIDNFFSVISGTVEFMSDTPFTIGTGKFFGEVGILSGRRAAADVVATSDVILLKTPRKQMVKLIRSVPPLAEMVDRTFAERICRDAVFPGISEEPAEQIALLAKRRDFKKGEVIIRQGDEADALYIIRRGSVKVSIKDQQSGDERTLTYLAAGNFVGEMALLEEHTQLRTATVTAAVPCETLAISREHFRSLVTRYPQLKAIVNETAHRRWLESQAPDLTRTTALVLDFLITEGVSDADNVLVIDSDLCVGCDNCEKACAATHGGYSRLDRKGGKSFKNIQVPISCRHCETPYCMLDCPPDALHRKPDGEVVIDEKCIGCGNCERNCPYGVIQMIHEDEPFSLRNLFFRKPERLAGSTKAAKCDLCESLAGGPACVRSCPTGAAVRLNPKSLAELIGSGKR